MKRLGVAGVGAARRMSRRGFAMVAFGLRFIDGLRFD